MRKINYRGAFITALFFGVFQAGMPLVGYFLGVYFADYINKFDHWIAFILLSFIGGKMIFDSCFGQDDDDTVSAEYRLDMKELLILSVATSIDALAVGIVFAVQGDSIFLSVSMIGIITFLLSFLGVIIGNRFGSKYEKKAQLAGGAVLVIIGLKLLLEGIGIIK